MTTLEPLSAGLIIMFLLFFQLMEDNAFVFTEIVCAVRICYVMAESCCILCQELFDRLVEI